MSEDPQTKQRPTLFISYAHENDALSDAVKTLADWLSQRESRVLTDHAYRYLPPPEGWQAWMLGCIHQADIVLVVCTPKLRQRYEKTASPDSGKGAAYEGAIVTQYIYDAAMRNTKFFPILPDDGSEDDISTTLRPWWNGHRFPSGYEGIHRMIFAAPAETIELDDTHPDGLQLAISPEQLDTYHQKLTNRLLAVAGAKPFYEALKHELVETFLEIPTPQSTIAIVQSFAKCPADGVQQLFFAVRRALEAVPLPSQDPTARRQAEEAAAALYCMAACRLVDKAAQAVRDAFYVVQVPSSERLICAIIATALFGGVLRLRPAEEEASLPRPEFVFAVRVSAGGDQFVESFERAAYAAVFPNDRRVTEISLDSGPLDEKLRAKLAARFDSIKYVKRDSLALVIHGPVQTSSCAGFASQYEVPIMLPTTEATTALLGMNANRLLAEIQELWEELKTLPRYISPGNQLASH